MQQLMRATLALIIGVFLLAAAEAPEQTALRQFKQHVAHLKLVRENARTKSTSTWSDIVYDVRKTDSLMLPIVATLSALRTTASDKTAPIETAFDAQLAYEDGAWKVQRLKIAILYRGEASYVRDASPTNDAKAFWDILERELGLETLHVRYED